MLKSKRPAEIERKQLPGLVTKIDEEQGIVEAIVSVMGVLDYGEDIIENGAYLKTIAERGRKIKVLNSHDTWNILSVVGVCLGLREIGKDELPDELLAKFPTATGGLLTTTQYLVNTPEGKGAFERIKVGAVDEYSIGYRAIKTEYREVQDSNGFKVNARVIKEIALYEYSPVVFGMNPATMTTGVKSASEAIEVFETLSETVGDWLTKAGRTLSARNAERIRSAFNSLRELMEDAGLLEDEEDAADDDVDSDDTVEDDGKNAAPPDKPELPLVPDEKRAEPGSSDPLTPEQIEKARRMRLIEIGLRMEVES